MVASALPPVTGRVRADVAQLVEHHLAKVRVAGSNPVVRSEKVSQFDIETGSRRWSGREARQRTANPCTRVQIPSPPRAAGAAVARFPDTEEVTGSIPVSPTARPLVRNDQGSFYVLYLCESAEICPRVGRVFQAAVLQAGTDAKAEAVLRWFGRLVLQPPCRPQ